MRIVAFPTPSQTEVQRNNQNMEVCMLQTVRNCFRVIQKLFFFLINVRKHETLSRTEKALQTFPSDKFLSLSDYIGDAVGTMESTLHYLFKPCINQNTKAVIKFRLPHVRNGAKENNIFFKNILF
jgi:hypothetical protein